MKKTVERRERAHEEAEGMKLVFESRSAEGKYEKIR